MGFTLSYKVWRERWVEPIVSDFTLEILGVYGETEDGRYKLAVVSEGMLQRVAENSIAQVLGGAIPYEDNLVLGIREAILMFEGFLAIYPESEQFQVPLMKIRGHLVKLYQHLETSPYVGDRVSRYRRAPVL
jgi:hypothetical protein